MRYIHYLIAVLHFYLISCQKEENSLIKDEISFELRSNYDKDYGKVEIIESGSNKFEKIQTYFDNSHDFEKVNNINSYPIFLIKSDHVIIYLSEDKIELVHKDSNNNTTKLSKNFISYQEFLEFQYLWNDNNWILDFGNLYGVGKLETDHYQKCGIKKSELNYFYKTGKWKFWNLKRKLIAEGEFLIDSIKTTVIGVNCENTIKVSKVVQDNWKFYDAAGNTITPSLGLIHDIESTKYIQH